ncbi:Hypothetical protein MVR_LOCUS377 [uncultured virus]|nr:Hypothetical protein MVR_LOCUS377 [uncultured virus]
MIDFDISDWDSDIFEELSEEIRTNAGMMANEELVSCDLAVHGSVGEVWIGMSMKQLKSVMSH